MLTRPPTPVRGGRAARAVQVAWLLASVGCQGASAGGSTPVAGDSLVHLLTTARTTHGIPALAAAVVRADGVVATGVSGVRRLGSVDSVRPSDRFHLGSNTKAMTALLLATLVQEGRLTWNTRPVDVLPELGDTMHPGYRDVTLEQLVTHRAGVPAFTSGFAIAMLPDAIYRQGARSAVQWRRAFAVHVLASQPKVSPGGGALYSNAGYTIAAAMAEAVTDTSWETLLQQRVFAPLGITGGFGWPAGADPAQPWGHWRRFLRGLGPHDPAHAYRVGALLAPAGDVNMAIGDYARFLQEHLQGLHGTDGLLPAAVIRELHAPRGGFAAGWAVQTRGGTRVSAHEGSAGTFHVLAVVAHDRDLAIAVFANAGSPAAAKAVREVAAQLLKR